MGGSVEDTLKDAAGIITGGLIGGPVGAGLAAGDAAVDALTPDMPDIPDMPKVAQAEESKPATMDDSGARAAEEERLRRARSQGRGSTVLTGSQGVLTPANVGTARLLG